MYNKHLSTEELKDFFSKGLEDLREEINKVEPKIKDGR